jgi:hypothetical protein
MAARVLIAFFSFLIALITLILIPIAHFGDKNETATKRLIVIGGISAAIFLIALFWRIPSS